MQVGFGKDFQASRNIRNDVGKNFRLLGSFMVEAVKRTGSPLRQYSRSPVCAQFKPSRFIRCTGSHCSLKQKPSGGIPIFLSQHAPEHARRIWRCTSAR